LEHSIFLLRWHVLLKGKQFLLLCKMSILIYSSLWFSNLKNIKVWLRSVSSSCSFDHIIDWCKKKNAPRQFSTNTSRILNVRYSRCSWFSVASTQRRWTRTGTAATSVAGSATNPWQDNATFSETSIPIALSATKAFLPMAARNAIKSSALTPRYFYRLKKIFYV